MLQYTTIRIIRRSRTTSGTRPESALTCRIRRPWSSTSAAAFFDIKGTDAERRLTGYSIDFIQKFFPYD